MPATRDSAGTCGNRNGQRIALAAKDHSPQCWRADAYCELAIRPVAAGSFGACYRFRTVVARAARGHRQHQGLLGHLDGRARGERSGHFLRRLLSGRSTYWWTLQNAPANEETDHRNWDRYRKTDTGWSDMRPLSVSVFDDVALVHFYGYWRAKTANGEVVTEAKRTEVWQKRDGRWLAIGGQITPVTAADADPYR